MADNLDIKVSTKAVDNEKTKAQEESINKIKEKKAIAKANKETPKKTTVTKAKEKDNSELASAIVAGLGNSIKRGGSFVKGVVLGLIFGIILTCVVGVSFKDEVFHKLYKDKEDMDAFLDEHFLGYTALDIEEAILGESVEHQELIVMEQPLETPVTLVKSGLGNLEIFSKTKNITYAGTGVYTVDMKYIDKDHIKVDKDSNIVTIIIPHTVLQYVNIDYDKIVFEDTEKGLLAFKDISLTVEQQTELEKSVRDSMTEVLSDDEIMAKADSYALLKVWEIFNPVVSKVNKRIELEVEFDD